MNSRRKARNRLFKTTFRRWTPSPSNEDFLLLRSWLKRVSKFFPTWCHCPWCYIPPNQEGGEEPVDLHTPFHRGGKSYDKLSDVAENWMQHLRPYLYCIFSKNITQIINHIRIFCIFCIQRKHDTMTSLLILESLNLRLTHDHVTRRETRALLLIVVCRRKK